MKRKNKYPIILSLVSCIIASLVLVNEAGADGTEVLGPPSIDIAPGSGILVEGIGLYALQPGNITIETPAGASVAQVLLYWSGRQTSDPGTNDIIQVNGADITGDRVGGPTRSPYPSSTYRADITGNGWVLNDAVNNLTVGGLDFEYQNDGAAVVVILNDGSEGEIQIADGNDFAYLGSSLRLTTEPVDFLFPPSDSMRVGTIWAIVTDITIPRDAAMDITIDGVTTRIDDVFLENEGDLLDIVEIEVPVPAGVDNVTVQMFSIDNGYRNAASLSWLCSAWVLPEPAYEDEGCTYTQGYWKNHPQNWPSDVLSLWDTDAEAMEILWTKPKRGNAYIILAHQYIAAELNMVNGASIPDDVALAWFAAQDLLLAYKSEGNIDKNTSASDRAWAIDLAVMLDEYNNGLIGPGHCDEIPCKPDPDKCDTKKRVKKITSPKSSPEACDKKEQDKKDKKDR